MTMRHQPLVPTFLVCTLLTGSASARPIGGWSAGGFAGRGPEDGVLVGVEGGWATMLASGAESAQSAWNVGARAGYAFAWGLELHLRYDDLGVAPLPARSPLQLA